MPGKTLEISIGFGRCGAPEVRLNGAKVPAKAGRYYWYAIEKPTDALVRKVKKQQERLSDKRWLK